MNWNRIEFCFGQELELRVCDAVASRWVPVSVCGVLVAHGNDPLYQVEEECGRTLWAGRERLRTIFENSEAGRERLREIFKNSENSLLTNRQTADNICTPDARATETNKTLTGS